MYIWGLTVHKKLLWSCSVVPSSLPSAHLQKGLKADNTCVCCLASYSDSFQSGVLKAEIISQSSTDLTPYKECMTKYSRGWTSPEGSSCPESHLDLTPKSCLPVVRDSEGETEAPLFQNHRRQTANGNVALLSAATVENGRRRRVGLGSWLDTF